MLPFPALSRGQDLAHRFSQSKRLTWLDVWDLGHTLLGCLLALLNPDRGEAEVDSRDAEAAVYLLDLALQIRI